MRTVSSDVLSHLQTNMGTEPVLFVEIQWVENGPHVMYTDQKYNGLDYPYPTIIQVGNLDMATQVDGASDSQQISITLDDVDGHLKTAIDSFDIHKRPVWVYQGFKGLTVDHKFLLFKGEISSPIVWDEGARTLTIDVLTRQEDTEVAFSMEEGDFPGIPEEALGKVWPLVFGEVCNMQAVQVRAPLRGTLTHGEGVHDFTIPARICQARYIQCPSVAIGETTKLEADGMGGFTEVTEHDYGPDLECVQRRFETICNLEYLLEQQQSYENQYLNIRNGEEFPQGSVVTLNIEGAIFRGTFNGTQFRILERTHPEYDTTEQVACQAVADRTVGLVATNWTEAWKESGSETAWYFDVDNYTDDCDADGEFVRQAMVGGPAASQKAFDDMPTSSFYWIPPGSEVYLEADAEILYIVSLLPGTINHVAAYKTQPTGRKLLLEVPSSYYTVYETDYDGYTVVEIGLEKKLSLYDSDWDDDLYISFTSTVGPNPVDVIEWLVEKYSDLTVDATSFAAVQARMTNYPTNFYVKERMNILDLIYDIAYQTRCAVYIRNDVVYIKYLSEEPTSVRTLTESDILSQSFRVTHTSTEDLRTKHTVSWRNGEAAIDSEDSTERKIILKYNVPKYGVLNEDYDYYTQNTYDTILKSATFWLIRRSHTWKLVEFETSIKHLDLDVFDCITLDVEQFSSTPVKCVITQAQFDNATNKIKFTAWTPIIAGTSSPYYWAWPADQSTAMRWPLPDDVDNADPGYDFEVSPPLEHILAATDPDEQNFVVLTSGDRFPADGDDTLPTLFCELSDFEDVEEEAPEFKALKLAQSVARTQINEIMSKDAPAAGSDMDDGKERTVCGSPEYGSGCVYEVTVAYIMPTSVIKYGGAYSGGCGCSQPGTPCVGAQTLMCHTFGALFSATLFYSQKKAEAAANFAGGGNFQCNQWEVYDAAPPKGIEDPSSSFGGCESAPGDPSAPNQGEQYEPKALPGHIQADI